MTIDELMFELKEARQYFGAGDTEVFIGDKAIQSINVYKDVNGACEFSVDPIEEKP